MSKILQIAVVLLLVFSSSTFAADRYWVGTTTSWNDPANWSTTSGGAGGAGVPTAADAVIFDAGGVGNSTVDVAIDVASFTVASGYSGVLDLADASYTHNVAGAVSFGGSGTVDLGDSTLIVGGDFASGAQSTWEYGTATVRFTGDGAQIGSSPQNFVRNVIFDADVSVVSDFTVFFGELTVTPTHTVTVNDNTEVALGAFNNQGTFALSSRLTIDRSAIQNYGTITNVGPAGAAELRIEGNMTVASLTFAVPVVFNKAGGPSTITIAGDLTFLSNFSVLQDIVVDNSGNHNLVFKGNIQSNTISTYTKGTGTITIDGTADQSVSFDAWSVEPIVINKPSGTVTLSGPVTTESLTVTAGAVDIAGNTLTTTGDLTMAAGTSMADSAAAAATGTISIGGNIDLNGATGDLITWSDADVSALAAGTNEGTFVTVSDSNNSSGNDITCTTNCVDSGGNTGWIFTPAVTPPPAGFPTLGNAGGGTWDLRVEIKVLSSAVDADLVNVPVHIDPADLTSGFPAHVKTDACDVRITTADGTTEVPLEIVSYDPATNNGEFYFLAPALASATDTSFYVYYGNPSATCYGNTDPLGSQAVWSDYYAVLHDGGLNNVTGNANPTLEGIGVPEIGAVQGIAGTATHFNDGGASDGGFYFPDPPVHVNGFYISSFVNYQNLSGTEFGYLWQHGDSATSPTEYYRFYESELSSTTYPRMRGILKDGSEDFTAIASDFETTRTPVIGKWEHYVQYDDPGNNRGALLNGQPLGAPTPMPAGFDPVGPLVVAAGAYDPQGGVGGTGGFYTERDIDGIYDEFRLLMKTPQNVDAWAKFEYDNIVDPTTTYSVQISETATGEPVGGFSADKVAGPSPLTVQFTDTSGDSGSPITSWSWDVDGDGQEDYTTQNPSHTYTTDGDYTVTLTVTNANGTDTATRTNFIVVATEWWMQCGAPNDIFAVYDPWAVGEAGGTLAESYQDLSAAGNDASVPSNANAPTIGANGWVFAGAEALDTGFLLDPNTTTILVYGEATADTIGAFIGAQTQIGNANSRYALHPTEGAGNRMYSFGASSDVRITGSFVNTPVSMGLAGGQPYLNGAADGAALSAATGFGDNPLYVGGFPFSSTTVVRYLTGNVRRVVISNSVLTAGEIAACHAAMTTDPGATPALPPVAQFSATPLVGEAPLAVQFTDSSTNTPTAWSWDVDNDGQEDYTTQNPQHTYSAPGTYTVSLTATNADGSDIETKTDYIRATSPPVPEVIPTTVTRSVRPGAAPVNADGFFDDYRPLP